MLEFNQCSMTVYEENNQIVHWDIKVETDQGSEYLLDYLNIKFFDSDVFLCIETDKRYLILEGNVTIDAFEEVLGEDSEYHTGQIVFENDKLLTDHLKEISDEEIISVKIERLC